MVSAPGPPPTDPPTRQRRGDGSGHRTHPRRTRVRAQVAPWSWSWSGVGALRACVHVYRYDAGLGALHGSPAIIVSSPGGWALGTRVRVWMRRCCHGTAATTKTPPDTAPRKPQEGLSVWDSDPPPPTPEPPLPRGPRSPSTASTPAASPTGIGDSDCTVFCPPAPPPSHPPSNIPSAMDPHWVSPCACMTGTR